MNEPRGYVTHDREAGVDLVVLGPARNGDYIRRHEPRVEGSILRLAGRFAPEARG